MPLHDLGYRHWEGELNPQSVRWWVIAQTGVRLAWRSRWLRRMLVLAWMPAVLAGIVFFAVENVLTTNPDLSLGIRRASSQWPFLEGVSDELEKDPASARAALWSHILLGFFRLPQGVLIVMLVALIAPPLIAQDLRSRAFLLYFSRPITRLEYVFGKMATVAAYLTMVTIVPGLVLYALGVGLSPNLSVVVDTWDLPFRVVASSLIVIIPTVTFALAMSALLGETRFATFCWFGPWVLGFFAFTAMTAMSDSAQFERGENPWTMSNKWSFLSPYHSLGEVESWIFGIQKDFNQVAPEAFMLSTVTLISLAILLRRVDAPMRV